MSRAKKSNSKVPTIPTCRIAYRYRAYPADLQEYRMENWFGALCGLYNGAVVERKDAYRNTGKGLTYSAQQNALPEKKKADPALRMVNSQVAQDCLQRVDKAYQKFFDDIARKKAGEHVKIGYPRFKKLEKYTSLTFPQVWMKQPVKDKGKPTGKTKLLEIVKFRFDDDSSYAYVTLPGIGDIKIRLHRSLDWNNAKTVTVKHVSSGDWYVCISVEMPLVPTLEPNGKNTGVDVGLHKEATTSDGSYEDHPRFLKKSEEKLKEHQRKLSKKQKGSNGYKKQKQVLAREHEHVANQRQDFLHKLSLWLVFQYAFIAFEKLNIPGMVKNPHLAKAILDAGWGTLIRFTAYKSVMLRGNEIVRVNPAYTSQDCSRCGARVPKTLAERMHICPVCGLEMCRDQNAARNQEFRAFGKVSSDTAVGTNKVGAGSAPNWGIIPRTQGETSTSAAPASRGKYCR